VKRQRIGVLSVLVIISSLLGGGAFGEEAKELRVCADPDNLPFSNQRLEGFENKIAALISKDLGATLIYYWWPHQRGLVRNTLRSEKCDVLIGIPKGFDPVLWTKPYYRTAYVVAYPKSKGFKIRSLDDAILKQVKIGVYLNTPPYDALGERGISENVVGYSLFYDYGGADPTRRPGRLIEDLFAGTIDVAIVWGPMAGYFGKKPNAPALELVPLQNNGSIPMTFEISMGVRKGEKELKTRLEEAIDRRQAEITKVLENYGVPLLARDGASLPGKEPLPAERRDPPGPHHRHE
jgi:mxaJ protein